MANQENVPVRLSETELLRLGNFDLQLQVCELSLVQLGQQILKLRRDRDAIQQKRTEFVATVNARYQVRLFDTHTVAEDGRIVPLPSKP